MLVLWVTVDQLPAEVLLSNLGRLGDRGLGELASQGVYYRRATYDHAVTFTATGHATLFTGKHPSEHAVIANEWADRTTGVEVACVEDPTERLLGEPTKAHQGTSPRLLLAPTLGDRLVQASDRRSRVFSVSFKDRGAILPGGHEGKAFWFSTATGRFVTSSYYYKTAPAWCDAWNQKRRIESFRGKAWELLLDPGNYHNAARDDRPYERDLFGLGRVFPHPLPGGGRADFFSAIACTPIGDELTLDFVMELARQEKLGLGESPDLLAISFSSTDMIGHVFGPDSLEAEDNLLRFNRVLSELFDGLREMVGKDRLLIVLSSDHGMGKIPESLAGQASSAPSRTPGGGTATTNDTAAGTADTCCGGRHDSALILERAQQELNRRFGFREPVAAAFWTPWIYLNEPAVLRQGRKIGEVERALAEILAAMPGVESAWTHADLAAGRFPPAPLGDLLRHAFNAGRAGSVLILPKRDWYLYTESHKYAATHGSHHDYDRTVPILIAGPGIKPAVIDREVHADALAHAVGRLLDIAGPECEPERRLSEAFDR
jgi:predicted AlkP superfamily pyrophosphatase or phosphodiesterase